MEKATWRGQLRDKLAQAQARAKAKAKVKPKAKTKGKSANLPLMANVLTAQALDQDLTLTTNLAGLSASQQQGRGTIPPRNGESRYLMPASELPVEVLTDGDCFGLVLSWQMAR